MATDQQMASNTQMATSFPLFPKLAAELRVRVWRSALQNESEGRIIEFHSCDPDRHTISVALSRPYPALFSVDREARSESMRADAGEAVPLNDTVGYTFQDGKTGTIYINFDKDTIFLSNRFHKSWSSKNWSSNEAEKRLLKFHQVLGLGVFRKMKKLLLGISKTGPPMNWWDGSGLELYAVPGHALETITLVHTGEDPDFPMVTLLKIREYIQDVHEGLFEHRGYDEEGDSVEQDVQSDKGTSMTETWRRPNVDFIHCGNDKTMRVTLFPNIASWVQEGPVPYGPEGLNGIQSPLPQLYDILGGTTINDLPI